MIDQELLGRARAAADAIAAHADETDRARRLAPPAVSALVEAGVFKLLVPRAFGGSEASPETALAAIEAIARADGSSGWCAMIGATSALMCGHLDDATAREVYGPADAISCGVFAPMGRAVRVDGGFRVRGRWPFASGCEHSAWRMGGTIVEGDPPLAGGAPNVQSMLFRAEETRVVDTWDVAGLRGTGSHDLVVEDVFVPAARSFSLIVDRPKQPGAVYAQPFFGLLAAGVAAVMLGVARGAVDEFVQIAKSKRLPGGKRTLAQRESIQVEVARADTRVRAARALLFEAIAAADGTTRSRAAVRLAACHAATESVAAVDAAFHGAGSGAIYATSALQRRFRDVHVAAQHLMVSSASLTQAGRVLLDVETDTSTL